MSAPLAQYDTIMVSVREVDANLVAQIRMALRDKHVLVGELGRQSGIKIDRLMAILRRDVSPTIEELVRIAHALRIRLEISI